jgi:hypothetical protein
MVHAYTDKQTNKKNKKYNLIVKINNILIAIVDGRIKMIC